MQPDGPSGPPTANPHTTLVILWAAMVMSVLLYFVVIQVLAPSPDPSLAASQGSLVETILLGIAIGLVGASFPIRNSILNKARAAEQQEKLGQLSGQAPRGASAGFRLTSVIVPLAMCEAAGVFGVVVYFLNGSDRYYLFLGLALIGMLSHFPRKSSDEAT